MLSSTGQNTLDVELTACLDGKVGSAAFAATKPVAFDQNGSIAGCTQAGHWNHTNDEVRTFANRAFRHDPEAGHEQIGFHGPETPDSDVDG